MTVVPVGAIADKKVWPVITCATFAHRCPNSSTGEDLTNDDIPSHFSGLLGDRYLRPAVQRHRQEGHSQTDHRRGSDDFRQSAGW